MGVSFQEIKLDETALSIPAKLCVRLSVVGTSASIAG